ncbi:hypothetical protein H4R33_002997 [Dimargaris cristalligena]|uniref:Alpha/Beta hydrolase protein n=1 Tax=Dimargaris cristalligena TaxID=215637 RepID=A0A4P9ZXR4_9FUNG|nr:hypothetical protein H4R33_002997 [Dimargaris cristalligena]RKP37702.1 Alpha/Beta hydrolase protein [Dimargaris cristalligena]|eukprot:RKP37702.1 Alpha/Beta hydrolase protein [Dimargaris cristalligena]
MAPSINVIPHMVGRFPVAEVPECDIQRLRLYASWGEWPPDAIQKLLSYSLPDPTLTLFRWFAVSIPSVPLTYNERFASKYQRTVGYVAINHDLTSVCLVFRGTTDIAEALTDMKFLMKRWPKWVKNSHVHAGFLDSFDDVGNRLYCKIRELLHMYPEYHLTIVGHSMGAAIASITAVDFVHRNQHLAHKVRVVTFGKPRVGNQPYIEHYNSLNLDSLSVVNQNDVVPHLPPRLIGYRHEDGEVWIKPGESGRKATYYPQVDNKPNPHGFLSVKPRDFTTKDHHWVWDVEM